MNLDNERSKLTLDKLKSRFVELVDVDIEDIVDVIEIDGNAMVYLKDKTKYAFLVEEEKVIPIEKAPSKKVEMVIDNELEREQEYTDEAYEEFEEDLLNEEIPDEYFEDLEDSEWDAIEEAVEKEENKEKVREAKKAAREKRLKAERERRLAEKSQSVDPTYNQETGHTYAQDVNDERLAEINKRLTEERRIEAQRQFDEALQAEKLRIESEKAAYADDLEKYRYKVGFADENKNQNTAPDFTQTVEPQKESEAEYESAGISKTPKKEKVEVAPVTEETYKQIEDVHQSETYGEQRQAHSYQTVNATFDGTHYVADNGYKFKQEEVLITPSGSIIDNRDNLYELDDKGNVLINATPVREPVAENFTVLNATLKDDYYIADNGDKYSRDEVIVTHTGAIVDNRDNYYALNNNGHVVYNPVVFESKPVETYKPLEVTLKDDYYVSNDGQKYKVDEVLVTPTGVIIENKNNHYKLDDEGFVVYAAPVITAPVEQVAYGYKTIEVLANNGDHFIADNGLKYKQEDVLVTHDGSIIDNRDNLYKLNHEGNIVVNTDIHRESIAQSYNIINATLEDNHYVADNGYKYKPEEVIVTKSGTIIDNRDNLYKLDNVGNVVVNDTPVREPVAQSYQVINARLEDNHYVADNGYRYRQEEVLVTKTGAIIDNRDNAYKLDSHGEVVINTAPIREQVAQSYTTINATLKDDYYVADDGYKYRPSEVLVTKSGDIVDNRDNAYRLNNNGDVIINTTKEQVAQGYNVINAKLEDNYYVADNGYKYRQNEVLVTPSGAIIDNRDNLYKLDNSGSVVVNTAREPIAQSYQTVKATFDGENYISDNGQRYKPTEVLVTRAGEVIDNRDNLYKIDNSGSVVVNSDTFKERQAQGYSVVNATLKDDHYVTADGYKYRQEEVLVTKTGAIIDNRDNIYKLDNSGNVVINTNREPIAQGYNTVKATFDGEHYVSDDGYKFKQTEVLVTKSGSIVDNRDNLYKLDNTGNVVVNTNREQVAQGYQTINATLKDNYYVADNGYKYRQDEVLVTKSGQIVDNRDNGYKLDNTGNVVINTNPVRETISHDYSTVKATFDGTHYVSENGHKFKPEEVLVTKNGTIIDNRDNSYKLDNSGNVVINHSPIKEVVVTDYATVKATFDGTHYVSDSGYKYRPEEVLITKTGTIIDNRDNAYKFDNHGNVVVNTIREQVAHSYSTLEATYKDGTYITNDGRKFTQSEVLVTSTGTIINNRDNLYKLNSNGEVVLNATREPIAQGYQTINATLKDNHYVADNGVRYRPEEVLVTKTGAIIDNRDNLYKLDSVGNIVVNTSHVEKAATGYAVVEATFKDNSYITSDGRKFDKSEVLVTPTGTIINNKDNLYKLNSNGEVVFNTTSGKEAIAQSYQTINAKFDGEHYVSDTGYKYRPEEILVTQNGKLIDNRDNAFKIDIHGNVVVNIPKEQAPQSYNILNAKFDGEHYVTNDGRKFEKSEVLVTSTGTIINNKDNLYKLDSVGNVVINTSHAEKIATGYAVMEATFKDGAYITTDGRRFEKADVLVTSTGAIINNKDNLYKLDNSGNVVLNTVREPIAQSYQTVKATFDGTHYVADNGYKYNPSEVLVTKTGIVIDNRDNIYKLDNFGNVVVNTTPIKETVAHSYNVVNATFKDGAYITTDGRKFTQSEVLVTPSGTIINNKDNLYRLDNNGQVVFNTHTVREPIAQGYNAVKATFDGTHYVSESGYKYRPDEVLITKTGVIVDNRDNLYKLDNAGNIIVNRSYIKEQAAQSYNVLSATFDGKQYVTTDGKRYNADEVLVTKTGAIIDNKDNLYKLDRMGNVVINKGDFGKTVYNPLSATFTGTHYITNDGRVYDKADVITLANGSIIENTTGRFRVDSQGNIVENRANNIPFVIPQRASSTSDMNAHYTIAGVPFLIDAKAKQTNMSLNETAHVVMRDLKIESTTLRGEILSARQELAKLKATGGDVEKIKALELLIKGKNDRIVEIAGHQMRVEDYIRFGSRKEFALTKESLEKAGYSKEHLRDLRNMAKAGNKTDISNVNKTRGGKGTTNIQEIHNNRMQALMSKFGGKFATGTGRAFKRMMRDSDELREEVEIYDETSLGARVVYGHASSALLKAELAKLGLDKATMMLQLEKIGVIAGVGNVSKMSLEDLQKAFTTLNLSSNAKKDLLEAIDLKKKLLMSNKELARMFLGDAGEYLGYSTKRLQKMLEVTTDLKVKKQIETALKYKKLSKLNSASMGKWRATASFITDAFRKFAKNDENISAILDLSDNTMGAYRVSKTAVNITKSLVKKNAEKKAAQEVGKKLVKTTMDVGKKQAAGKAAHAANQQLIRTMATKEGGKAVATGVGGKVANTKLGQTLASGMAKIKGVFGIGGAAGSAGAGGAAGTAAGAGGTIAGGSVAVVAAIVILILLVVGFGLLLCSSLYTMIFGDETTDPNKTGMSVVEMIDYLEDKNTNLLVELENHEKGTPSKKDKQGNTLSEYTKIHYTFYDENGNICITTNNTKELISMAAVYFEQDLSDKNAIKKYLDEMWDKTHIITYTESALYGCDGNVCLHEDGTFASDAKGFNAGERKFQCTEDYYSILYNNCFMIPTENTRRIEIDKLSERLANSYLTASQFNGISPILVKTSLKGYGCKELVNTVYCTNINSITNTEILVRLVEATGKSYSTLKSDQACVVGGKKHSNSYNKAASGCGDYKLYYQTNEMSTAYDLGSDLTFTWNSSKKAYINKMGLSFKGFSKYVLSSGQEPNLTEITLTYNGSTGSGYNKTYNYSYRTYTYVCQEVNKSCPGHAIAYHYCDGQHKEKVCYGHVDLTINICVKSFDDTFSIYTDDSRADFTWDEDNIEWAKSLYGQDWEDLYGVYVSGSLFADDMVAAIMPTHPNSLPIPLYDQTDYPNSPYGAYGTVASHGCGITCVAMLNAYYIDEDVSPAYLARIFGNYNTEHGSYWSLFGDSAEVLGIPFEKQTSSWSEVVQALQDGKPVVSIQNSNGIFTSGGHFILLTGITPEGKILVNDPNGANYYKNATLIDGFANGFAQSHIQVGSSGAYWIYGVKP